MILTTIIIIIAIIIINVAYVKRHKHEHQGSLDHLYGAAFMGRFVITTVALYPRSQERNPLVHLALHE